MKIISNNKPRPVLFGFELSANERKNFDYLSDEEMLDRSFVRYRGELYDLGDIMRIEPHYCMDEVFRSWHGYVGDSHFSGVVFRLCDDSDFIICGRYIA
jgi:hypothetical protein